MITLDEYIQEDEKASAIRNLLETDADTLEYMKNWGVNRDILRGKINTSKSSDAVFIHRDSITSYIIQRAALNNIIIDANFLESEDFTQNIEIKG